MKEMLQQGNFVVIIVTKSFDPFLKNGCTFTIWRKRLWDFNIVFTDYYRNVHSG